MDWNMVREWLENHGHINSDWGCVEVSEDGFYAEDEMENTFISLFTRGSDKELVAYVGMMNPKVSVGSPTGIEISSHEDVIGFLENNLEYFYDSLMEKVVRSK